MTQSPARLIFSDIDFDAVDGTDIDFDAVDESGFLKGTKKFRPGSLGDYAPIIKSFGDVLVKVDEEGCQGDSFVLLRKDGQYGFLCFGWGTCSGCDALQACETVEELDELIDRLQNQIKWFDSLAEAQAYIADDLLRRGSYYYHIREEWNEFKAKVMEVAE